MRWSLASKSALLVMLVVCLPPAAGDASASTTEEGAAAEDPAAVRQEESAESHGEEAASEEEPLAPGPARWGDKLRFESSDGRFSLELGNRVQFRFTQEEPEEGDSRGSFRVRRGKLSLRGRVYSDWKYKVQVDYSGSSTTLNDAYFVYTTNPRAQLWLGQGKAFFGRQFLNSSAKLQFVDRSIASGRFAHGRDQGLALLGTSPGGHLEYNLGLYNGNGPNQSRNDDGEYLGIGRLVWMPLGAQPVAESSLTYPEDPLLSLGVSTLTNSRAAGRDDVERWGAELAFEYQGLAVVGEWYDEEVDLGGGGTAEADGGYAQLAYLFPNRIVEIAGRWSTLQEEGPVVEDQTETGVALNVYLDGHSYKVQTDLRRIEDDVRDLETDVIRVQLQIAF